MQPAQLQTCIPTIERYPVAKEIPKGNPLTSTMPYHVWRHHHITEKETNMHWPKFNHLVQCFLSI